jgi:hypothetical protein
MKQILLLSVPLVLHLACTRHSDNKRAEASVQTEAQIGQEFNQADSAAREGQLWAFLKLYDIASNDFKYNVEYSEVAQVSLTELLFYRTNEWIQALSQLSDSSQLVLKSRFHWAYVGDVDFQIDSTVTQDRYQKTVLSNLSKFRGNHRQQQFAKYFVALFDSAISKERNAATRNE